MRTLNYPSDRFVKTGKLYAGNLEDFSVEFHSEKHRRCVRDLEFFLFETGVKVGFHRLFLAFWRMLPFLVVHFFSLGVGGKAHYSPSAITYRF